MKELKGKEFIDLRLPVFYNKKTGQRSINLPKRKIKSFERDFDDVKEVKISLWRPTKK